MTGIFRAFFLCVAVPFLCLIRVAAQTSVPCPSPVQYRAPPQELVQKIRLLKPVTKTNDLDSTKRISSPQGMRWFIEVGPDYMSVKKPWNTTLSIGSDSGVFLQADFLDHGNTFSARWINEKLLFIQVWWGRFASSDLILDVDQGKFIYNEFAHYWDSCQ